MQYKYLQISILIILAVLALFIIKRMVQPQVTDFQSCQNAGGTVTEGEPVTCMINGQTFVEQRSPEPEVIVVQPKFGDLVTSPMHVKGKVRGFWMFEGNLPMTLKDSNGKILYLKGYQVPEGTEWMTSNYVPFETDIVFSTPETSYGVFIISKDNPSDRRDLDASFAVPVKFK
jgi:hypothetical protein